MPSESECNSLQHQAQQTIALDGWRVHGSSYQCQEPLPFPDSLQGRNLEKTCGNFPLQNRLLFGSMVRMKSRLRPNYAVNFHACTSSFLTSSIQRVQHSIALQNNELLVSIAQEKVFIKITEFVEYRVESSSPLHQRKSARSY